MRKRDAPVIKPYKGKDDYVWVIFYPDMEKFSMESLDEDTVKVLSKRVHDIAGLLPPVQVFLNGTVVQINGFESYMGLYLPQTREDGCVKLYERLNDRWEVGLTVSEGQFRQVSFVNKICTTKGGTHVNYIAEQIVEYLQEAIRKKHSMRLKGHQVRSYLWVFVNAIVINPVFDSQTKETLITRADCFADEGRLPKSFLQKLAESGIVEGLVAAARAKERANFIKHLKAKNMKGCTRLVGIEKLEDANWAGTERAHECTLILTEGDSAKAFAMAGLEVVGRDKYGVFPLRGKLPNTRCVGCGQLKDNAEIHSIIRIMGLVPGEVYGDARRLRYGRIMIMADQDCDGSHIKGLIINFVHTFWPGLLRVQGFICQFITPIIKVTKKNKVESFFTVADYEKWVKDKSLTGCMIKYYKGLGTNTQKEAKEYFRAIDTHTINFQYLNEQDDQAILMAFGRDYVQQRREWLETYQPTDFLTYSSRVLSYSEFINKELIQFSLCDNRRSIPSVCDGLKPSQRKILYACFKRRLEKEIKVAQLAGYVAEHSCYHHGEASLTQTIMWMAQNFTGSNNINLLQPIGQFGTRYMGGSEAASPRYVYTKLSKLARLLYREEDDALLNHLVDEGQQTEPEHYVPIVPMVLVNGSEGIGVGWRSSIPNYSPREVVACLKKIMCGEVVGEILPWYKNFEGTIVREESTGKLICYGKAKVLDNNKIEITEIPVKSFIGNYKKFLEALIEPNKKRINSKISSWTKPHSKLLREDKEYRKYSNGEHGHSKRGEDKENVSIYDVAASNKLRINDFKEYHKGGSIKFILELTDKQMEVFISRLKERNGDHELMKTLKLASSISTDNYICFDAKGNIRRYGSPNEIIYEYYRVRLALYKKRKEHLIHKLNEELLILSNKLRFITEIMTGQMIIFRKDRMKLIELLNSRGYAKMPERSNSKAKLLARLEEVKECSKEYDYLLGMCLWTFTNERLAELETQKKEKEEKIEELMSRTETQLWEKELDEFVEALDQVEEEEREQERKANMRMESEPPSKMQGLACLIEI
eukprot:TRINITY_DN7769_c0_g2_i5.p1 TRINITY_DN7769_c0_g2~~TRINITY_DN7769_c0_g2_i5.p1  ORF type:complete len:1175 (+),score=288.49 TRINITY_DN7769_c0_g2_i5:395-3526(+)